jgi:hypothetical protein
MRIIRALHHCDSDHFTKVSRRPSPAQADAPCHSRDLRIVEGVG